jgi:hypothetical protein
LTSEIAQFTAPDPIFERHRFRLAIKTDLGSRIVRAWSIVPAAVNERGVGNDLLKTGPPGPAPGPGAEVPAARGGEGTERGAVCRSVAAYTAAEMMCTPATRVERPESRPPNLVAAARPGLPIECAGVAFDA